MTAKKSTRKPVGERQATPTLTPLAADQKIYTPNKDFPLILRDGDTPTQHARKVAEQILSPEAAALRIVAAVEGKSIYAEKLDAGGILDQVRALQDAVNAGDLKSAEAMLIAQAFSLQALSVRLIERATAQDWLPQFETMMRLGLKAQAQSRLAIEALATLKHGPAVVARNAQVNVANGPQQVNNGNTERERQEHHEVAQGTVSGG